MAVQGKSHVKEMAFTFCALIILTIITVAIAKIDFGSQAINVTIAMIVATVKATMVALYFMHLKWEDKLIVGFAVLSIPFIILAMGLMVLDVSLKSQAGNYLLK